MHAAPQVQLFAGAGNGWPRNVTRYHEFMPISCHLRNSTALLDAIVIRVSSALASTESLLLSTYTQQAQIEIRLNEL